MRKDRRIPEYWHELDKLWDMIVTIIKAVDARWTIIKDLPQRLVELDVTDTTETIQIIAQLKLARILRNMLTVIKILMKDC